MPSGLLIDLNDGGKPMEITSGLRCPSYGGGFIEGPKNPKTVNVSNYVSGSNVFVIPQSTAMLDSFNNFNSLNPYTISGGSVTQNNYSGNDLYVFKAQVWQILPVSTGGRTQGLLVQNSSDFLSITTASMVGSVIWMGRVNIPTGGWSTPTIAGYNRGNYLVFARANTAAVIDFDGSVVRAFTEAATDGDNPTTATVDIVIISSGVAQVPGVGLNMWNAAGQCVFSTTKRPFVFEGSFWNPAGAALTLNGRYVPLGRYGFESHTRPNTSTQYVFRQRAIKFPNGVAQLGRGKYLGWDVIDHVGNPRNISLSLPVLPDMYL